MTANEVNRKIPCSIGRSLPSIASTVSEPMPGQENSASIVMAPETTNPRFSEINVTTGQQGVAHRVVAKDPVSRQPDRAGGRHEVLVEHVGERGAHDHHVLAQQAQRQRDDGQRRVLQDVPHVADAGELRARIGLEAGGEGAHRDGEQPDQHHPQPELRHRIQDQRPLRDRGVAGPSSSGRGDHAEPRAQQRRQHRGRPDQQQGVGDGLSDLGQHGAAGRIADVEVALDGVDRRRCGTG